MEVMTQLLAAFKTVKGFDERAEELAKSCGESLFYELVYNENEIS